MLRQSGESLAGRITYINMGPFNVLELPTDESTLLQLWTRGGFPGSYLAPNDTVSLRWRDDFIRTYLERDVPLFGPRVPHGVLERLWTMLAHGQGTLLNASRLASALQIAAPTVQRYIDLLAAAPERTVASFCRTAAGAEIDLLLEIPGHGLWVVEVKRSLSGRPEKVLYIACQHLKPDKQFVVNSGREPYPIDADTVAIGVPALARMLSAFVI